MNKIAKLFVTFISAITLALVSITSSNAKVEGDYIVLGSAISLTGKYSSNGVHTQNGYNMAVDRINKMGGVEVQGKKYKFEIIYYDDESNPKRAAQLAERLIKQDGVHYMLGPYSSGLTKAIAPVTEKYKIPMVEANGASRSLFTKGYKYLFAVLSPANQYLEVAIDLAVEKNGGKPVKIVYPYGYGDYQWQCHVGDKEVTNFINSGFNFEYFNGHMRQWDAKYGFCQFFCTETYKKLGGENENFVAYGYEDDERYFRFNLLSSVARLNEYVFHLEHGRTKNSWFNNPYCEDNKKLWENLKVKGKESLLKYYEEIDYIKRRNG